ncbi:hypothetical protein HOD38_02225 [archaeon]|jgi:hypothetical protein|nr:hypothetical protein [archaeon]MBT4397058.1 hypothetical protein [archaeon]MBT4441050.1 hypothetical protein [archaeon]
MGIWKIKKGESGGVTTAVKALMIFIVIVVMVVVIMAFKDHLSTESQPIAQEFDEALAIAQQAHDPESAQEIQLQEAFDALVNNITYCWDVSNKEECGCTFKSNITPPDGSFIGIYNKQDAAHIVAFRSDDVPIASEVFSSKSFGLLKYQESTNQFVCQFPDLFLLTEKEKTDLDFSNSNWAATKDNNNYFKIVDKIKLSHLSTLPTVKEPITFVDINEGLKSARFDTPDAYYEVKHDGEWKIKTAMQIRFHKLAGLYGGGSIPDNVEWAYIELAKKSESEGMSYLGELKAAVDAGIYSELQNKVSDDTSYPAIIKLDNNNYCFVTELIGHEEGNSAGGLLLAKPDIVIEGDDTKFYFGDYPYYYIAQKEMC